MAAADGPVGDDELDRLFTPLDGLTRIGVAVSGGPDSTALLLLLRRWTQRGAPSPTLHVLTVDHGLRVGSASECASVGQLAASLKIPVSVLVWAHAGPPPAADIQAAARKARYRLMSEAAVHQRLEAIVLGHTLDDKAETLVMRLARGSGVAGLAAMAPDRRIHGVRFVRPLLGLSKARLIATLQVAGLSWIVDPSNTDADRFLRARVRALMPRLAAIGLTPARLAATADRLARAAAAIDRTVEQLAATALVDHGGVVSLDLAALLAAPDEVALRLIGLALRRVRPASHPPRVAPLEAFLAEARAGGSSLRRRTLGGVVLDPRRSLLWLYAEAGRSGFPVLVIDQPGAYLWDGRFVVAIASPLTGPLTIAAARGAERRFDLPLSAAGTLPVIRGPEGLLAMAGEIKLHPLACGPEEVNLSPLLGWQAANVSLHDMLVRSDDDPL